MNTLTRSCEMIMCVLSSAFLVICARKRVFDYLFFWQGDMDSEAAEVGYTWSISSRRRNAEASWSSGNPSRLSQNDRVWLWVIIKGLVDSPKYGKIQRIQRILADEHNVFVSEHSIRRALVKYAANGYELDIAAVKFARRSKFPDATKREIIAKLLKGASVRSLVKDNLFKNNKNKKVRVSRRETVRIAKKAGLVVCVPKEIRIRVHFSHHVVVRIAYAAWWLTLEQSYIDRMIYSDEMSFAISLPINRQNDILWVPRDKQSTSNEHRRSKGSTGKMCSIWIAHDRYGIIAYHIFIGTLDVPRFHDILLHNLAPVLRKREKARRPVFHTTFYHDKVTNAKELQDETVMDKAFGSRSKWLRHAETLCREPVGREFIESVYGRKAYWRKKTAPRKVCECKIDGECVPLASPVLNLCENVNGFVRQTLSKMVRSGEVEWKGNPAKKFEIIKKAVQKVHVNKSFWRNMYANAAERHRYVREHSGLIYRKS